MGGQLARLLVQRAVLSVRKFNGQLMTSDAPQGLMLMPVLFNVCVDNLCTRWNVENFDLSSRVVKHWN